MALQPVIAVIGSTGSQGGGLVRAILADPSRTFRVRALTRNPEGDKARELAAAGAETVAADLDDLDSLKAAFADAHGAFCVTNFWEHFSPEKEVAQAANLAEAARAAGVRHVVWSTLEDSRDFIPLDDDRMPTLMGHYKVPHFDGKAEGNAEFQKRNVPTTFLLTSFYWENFISFGMGPQKGPDGKLAITLPMGDAKLPSIAVEDIGKCALGVFKQGESLVGKTVGVAGEHLTGAEMAAVCAKALGQPVGYNAVEPDAYRAFGFPGAEDLGNMFQFNRDFSEAFCAARNLEFARTLNPELQSLEAWLGVNKERIPL